MSGFDALLKDVNGLDTLALVDKVSGLDIDRATKQMLVSTAILERLGRVPTGFAYRAPLAAEDAALALQFDRGFQHADWTDGVSPVQAGETPSEAGFNLRFHAIEKDTDALAAEIGRAFLALGALRRATAAALEDVAAAIRRLEAGVRNDGTISPKLPQIIEQIPVLPRAFDPKFDPKIWERPDRPGEGLVLGMPATKLKRSVFNGQDVDMWSTPAGIFLSPVVAAGSPGAMPALAPELDRTARLAGWIAANQPQLATEFGANPFTPKQVVDHFGDADLGDGMRLRDVLVGVDQTQPVANPQALFDLVAEHQAGSIAGNGFDAVAGAVGLQSGVDKVADVPVASLGGLDKASAQALSDAGIRTVGELGAASPARVQQVLSDRGIATDARQAGQFVGIGAGLGKIAQRFNR